MKVKLGEKIAYACGDFSNNTAYLFVGTFVLSFLSIGLGLSGTVAGTIIMVVTIWDAVNDVLIGNIVDRMHAKGTKYSTMLRYTVIPVGVMMVLLFYSPNFSIGAKIAYATIIYAVYTVAQTSYQVPFGALSSAMTDDTDQRIQLGAFRDWGANVGSLLVNSVATLMIVYFSAADGDMTARGFFISAIICAVVLIAGGIIPGLFCKERVPLVEAQKAPLGEGIKAYCKNRNAIMATVVICMVNCALVVRASFGVYYALYYLGDATLLAPILTVMSVVPIICIFFIPVLTKKLDRRAMFSLAGVFIIVGGVIQLLSASLTGSIISSIFCGLSLCFSITVAWGAIPDIADYGEYVSGVFCPSMCYSTMTFAMKLATAIANYILGVILDAYGFNSEEVTQTAIDGICMWYALIPIILGVVTLLAGLFFNLTHKRLEEVHVELDKRHEAESGNEAA